MTPRKQYEDMFLWNSVSGKVMWFRKRYHIHQQSDELKKKMGEIYILAELSF